MTPPEYFGLEEISSLESKQKAESLGLNFFSGSLWHGRLQKTAYTLLTTKWEGSFLIYEIHLFASRQGRDRYYQEEAVIGSFGQYETGYLWTSEAALTIFHYGGMNGTEDDA